MTTKLTEPTNVIPDSADETLIELLRCARDEAWPDEKIAQRTSVLLDEWRERDIELTRLADDLRRDHRLWQEDRRRVRDALIPLLPSGISAEDKNSVLRVGYIAEETATVLWSTQSQLKTTQEYLANATELAENGRRGAEKLRANLIAAERATAEATMLADTATARAEENHKEALRAISALEGVRIDRNSYSDALRSAQRQMIRFEIQLGAWKNALGVYQGDIDTEPVQAVRALKAATLRIEVAEIHERYPGLYESDEHPDWGRGVVWVCDRLSAAANMLTAAQES
jgi:hypothetical protein